MTTIVQNSNALAGNGAKLLKRLFCAADTAATAFVARGGLISYDPERIDQYRRAATGSGVTRLLCEALSDHPGNLRRQIEGESLAEIRMLSKVPTTFAAGL
jgi:hypothetical protein